MGFLCILEIKRSFHFYGHELLAVARQDIELKVFAIYAALYPLAGVAYSNSGLVE